MRKKSVSGLPDATVNDVAVVTSECSQRACWRASDPKGRHGYVSCDGRTRRNEDVICERYTFDDRGSRAEPHTVAGHNVAAKRCVGRDMNGTPKLAFVVDRRAGIDDAKLAYLGLRLYDSTRHYDAAGSEYCSRRHAGMPADDNYQFESEGARICGHSLADRIAADGDKCVLHTFRQPCRSVAFRRNWHAKKLSPARIAETDDGTKAGAYAGLDHDLGMTPGAEEDYFGLRNFPHRQALKAYALP